MGDWKPFVYGGIASVTAECGTFPIDTTKTRLQIQGQTLDCHYSELKYRGMFHAMLRISKEEGVRALYAGIAPAVLRQASYGTIKIGIYYSIKKRLMKNSTDENIFVNVFCGIIAGVVSSSVANPTDVLKVRMQARNESIDARRNTVQCFYDIYRLEGVRGLWRGVGPTAQRAAIIVGVELPAYDITKRYLINYELMADSVFNHFVSSFVAGLAGAVASNPIDVIKTRLMNQRNLKSSAITGGYEPVIYRSSLECFVHTIKTEGILALYKGFIPTWFRLGPWNIIFFVTYEQLKKFY